MAIGDFVSELLGRGSRLETKMYGCSACDATFESAKQPERASCPECLSADVSPLRTTDSHT